MDQIPLPGSIAIRAPMTVDWKGFNEALLAELKASDESKR